MTRVKNFFMQSSFKQVVEYRRTKKMTHTPATTVTPTSSAPAHATATPSYYNIRPGTKNCPYHRLAIRDCPVFCDTLIAATKLEIPEYLLCQLSRNPMRYPTSLSCGCTFEHVHITHWIQGVDTKCPECGAPMLTNEQGHVLTTRNVFAERAIKNFWQRVLLRFART